MRTMAANGLGHEDIVVALAREGIQVDKDMVRRFVLGRPRVSPAKQKAAS